MDWNVSDRAKRLWSLTFPCELLQKVVRLILWHNHIKVIHCIAICLMVFVFPCCLQGDAGDPGDSGDPGPAGPAVSHMLLYYLIWWTCVSAWHVLSEIHCSQSIFGLCGSALETASKHASGLGQIACWQLFFLTSAKSMELDSMTWNSLAETGVEVSDHNNTQTRSSCPVCWLWVHMCNKIQ